MTTTTTSSATPRHYPVLHRVTGGWVAACGCGWRHPTVTPRERTARRAAWDHIGQETSS